ncbi:hypothetical protein V7S43_007232 [Phytophthora oleae]|uniref:Uncharacterized protein n=1 Tax=Phytophthora oleae TaxID=2107226 RepID=A0ABD3FMX7_9STRA
METLDTSATSEQDGPNENQCGRGRMSEKSGSTSGRSLRGPESGERPRRETISVTLTYERWYEDSRPHGLLAKQLYDEGQASCELLDTKREDIGDLEEQSGRRQEEGDFRTCGLRERHTCKSAASERDGSRSAPNGLKRRL